MSALGSSRTCSPQPSPPTVHSFNLQSADHQCNQCAVRHRFPLAPLLPPVWSGVLACSTGCEGAGPDQGLNGPGPSVSPMKSGTEDKFWRPEILSATPRPMMTFLDPPPPPPDVPPPAPPCRAKKYHFRFLWNLGSPPGHPWGRQMGSRPWSPFCRAMNAALRPPAPHPTPQSLGGRGGGGHTNLKRSQSASNRPQQTYNCCWSCTNCFRLPTDPVATALFSSEEYLDLPSPREAPRVDQNGLQTLPAKHAAEGQIGEFNVNTRHFSCAYQTVLSPQRWGSIHSAQEGSLHSPQTVMVERF